MRMVTPGNQHIYDLAPAIQSITWNCVFPSRSIGHFPRGTLDRNVYLFTFCSDPCDLIRPIWKVIIVKYSGSLEYGSLTQCILWGGRKIESNFFIHIFYVYPVVTYCIHVSLHIYHTHTWMHLRCTCRMGWDGMIHTEGGNETERCN